MNKKQKKMLYRIIIASVFTHSVAVPSDFGNPKTVALTDGLPDHWLCHSEKSRKRNYESSVAVLT